MTKQERKIKSMLNYYQIDTGGTKNEKMTKKKKEEFLDRFNTNYDAHTVNEIFQKIRDIQDKSKGIPPENMEDGMSDNIDENMDDVFKEFDDHRPIDDEITDDEESIEHLRNSLGTWNRQSKESKEIEDFINWISSVLYSADHKVIITEDGLTTNIKLVKIKGGKKK